ncbi:MAG TPA: phosphohydrolase [Candidatus Levybacteria bacterium]|nr:phosphohydrolase [Candidatus Levybacteria bacterium]
MTRTEAYSLLIKHLQNKNLVKHCLACEVAMKGLYDHLHPNGTTDEKEMWGITGLLHDIDYEIAQNTNQLDKHGSLIFEKEPGVIPSIIEQAIRAHNYESTGTDPQSDMDWSITIVDGLTGFIVACALIHPDKKLAPITVEFIQKRFGQPAFAKNVRREVIALCEEKLNIPFQKFIEITLTSMQSIHKELGL